MSLCLKQQFLFSTLLLCILILHQVDLQKGLVEADAVISPNQRSARGAKEGDNKPPADPVLDCAGLCGVRCGQHSRPNLCMRACGTCCSRCKCVPPGTSGNREACGACYTDMTTHGNRTKCP